MNAPMTAKPTVIAIGLNIFPSVPTNAKIGMYTIKIMISPNAALLRIFEADLYTSAIHFFLLKVFCVEFK
jgi:hypothetical protein